MDISKEVHDDVVGAIEDVIEYACDKYQLSGEMMWTLVQQRATARLAEIQGLLRLS